MKLEDVLASVAPEQWVPGQIIIFDWYDGPRQGIGRLAHPRCEFAFEMLAQRYNPDDLDDRLFRLSELPSGSVDEALDAIRSLGGPANVLWVPVWRFETEEKRRQADQRIDDILVKRRETAVVVYSRDMATFLGRWQAEAGEEEAADWFSILGVP
jgi:hypothetical protein